MTEHPDRRVLPRAMIDKRKKGIAWTVTNEEGKVVTWDQVQVAVLMDIRDELQQLNGLLRDPYFLGIPRALKRISSNTDNLPKVKR